MSDGGSTVGHATGVRAIVCGCDRANAQGAVKSVILADVDRLNWSLFPGPGLVRETRFRIPDGGLKARQGCFR